VTLALEVSEVVGWPVVQLNEVVGLAHEPGEAVPGEFAKGFVNRPCGPIAVGGDEEDIGWALVHR
jgi:hypothetical protein